MRFVKQFTAVLIAAMIGFGNTGFADVGESGWMIFRKAAGVNTRGVTSVVTNNNSLASMLYNPAILGSRTQQEAMFMSEAGFAGDAFGGLLFGYPLKKGMIAGGLMGYDAGIMDLNWIENGQLMTEKAAAQRDLFGTVSYGFPIRKDLLAGGTLKLASSQIAERKTAYAVATDMGLMYFPSEKLSLSAAVQNVGVSTKFIDRANPLPLSFYTGAGYSTKVKDYNLLAGVGVTYNAVDATLTPEIGAELRYDMISMSVSYAMNRKESALQLGLGVNYRNIEFGYSYVPGIYLDSIHRLNFSYRFTNPFGGKKAPAKKAAVKTSAPAPKSKALSVPAVPKLSPRTKAMAPRTKTSQTPARTAAR